jgi:YesN/AraC family two-component response regulator
MNKYLIQQYSAALKIPFQLYQGDTWFCDFGPAYFQPNPSSFVLRSIVPFTFPICHTISSDFVLTGLVKVQNSDEFFVVGPALTTVPTRKQAENILSEMHISKSRTEELLYWFHTLPKYDIGQFCNCIKFLYCLINNVDTIESVFVPYHSISENFILKEKETTLPNQLSHDFEDKIVACVELGNPELLNSVFVALRSSEGVVPTIASDASRSFKNTIIYSIGIVSRAAFKGGLDYDTMSSLSFFFLQQIGNAECFHSINSLFQQMCLEYAVRVQQCNQIPIDSLVVKKIINYINHHLNDPLSPTMIAKNMDMNCSYLCKHFKNETGKTITQYINGKRVDMGKLLLETTEQSLADIAADLGYSSQNYFNTIFRKYSDLSPSEYRRLCKKI